MPEYSPNLNIEKALGTENVNRAYFMRVIDDIDEKVGVANGLAKLDANGNVLKADGTQAGEVTKAQFDAHTGQAATTLKVGHVQLSDAVTSTDVTKAATSNAVKKAYDRADAAFTSASNGKTAITNAVTGADPRVVVPTDPTFTQLATAISQIETKKSATGSTARAEAIPAGQQYTFSGLGFMPKAIYLHGIYGDSTTNSSRMGFFDGKNPGSFSTRADSYGMSVVARGDGYFTVSIGINCPGGMYFPEWIAYG